MEEQEYVQAWLEGYCKDNEIIMLPANKNGSPPGRIDDIHIVDSNYNKYREIDATRQVYIYRRNSMQKCWELEE